jgi:hypothetical protein
VSQKGTLFLFSLSSRSVSRILFRSWYLQEILGPASIIYLAASLLPRSYDLPPGKDEQPWSRYTWSFNPSDVRLPMLPPEPVSSYLTFSPFPSATLGARSGRLFSVTLLYPRGYLPVRKHGALCCPDFPFRQLAERWNNLLRCKNNTNFAHQKMLTVFILRNSLNPSTDNSLP